MSACSLCGEEASGRCNDCQQDTACGECLTCDNCDDWFEDGTEGESGPAGDPGMQSVLAVCTRCSVIEQGWWNGEGVPTCESCGQPFELGVAR